MNLLRLILEMKPDSREFERLDRADKWLARYTYENLDKWPGKEILSTLVDRYPIDKPIEVFRGINFRSKERFQEFMETISDGILKTNGISSWTFSYKDASQFAVTQPTYFLNSELMSAEAEKSRNKEWISGYRGVILQTTAEPGNGIDVRKSRVGHEPEIVLVPGEYHVRVHQLKKYADQLADKDTDIDSVIMGKHGEQLEIADNSFRDYVLHHHLSELSDSSKHHLFMRQMRNDKMWGYEILDRTWSHQRDDLRIYFRDIFFNMAINGVFTPEDTERARKIARRCISEVIKTVDQNHDKQLSAPAAGEIAKFAGMERQWLDCLKRKVGSEYRQAEEDGRKINQLPADQRDRAISDHADRIKKILSQIS